MRSYTKMTPLTPEKKVFAERNHPVVLWYLKAAELEPGSRVKVIWIN